jgi:hypothetical protein
VKTRGRNNLVEYFSAAPRIPVLNSVSVRCFLEFHLDIPNAGEIYAPETFSNRVFTQSARISHQNLPDRISLLAGA